MLDFADTLSPGVTFGQVFLTVLWLFAFAWAARNRWLWPGGFAAIGVFVSAFPLFIWEQQGTFAFYFLGVLMHWFLSFKPTKGV